ncbi:hypothetical protein [Ktedonobacter sp. SOSP1-52]|nr:hypothetical protein [Ktedonobacter sp. SOSP1-52]
MDRTTSHYAPYAPSDRKHANADAAPDLSLSRSTYDTNQHLVY